MLRFQYRMVQLKQRTGMVMIMGMTNFNIVWYNLNPNNKINVL